MSSEKLQFELGRPVADIASEINIIKDQTRQVVLHAASEIGRRLIEAKEQVLHGEWGEWLKTNVDYSQSTANNFMKIHREFDLNSQVLANLSYTKAVALFGIEQDEREAFVEKVNADEISARDLEMLVKEKQQLEAEKKAIEEQLKKEQQARDAQLQEMQLQLDGFQEQIAEAEQVQQESKELEQKLAVAESTIDKLQGDLKTKPIDVPAVVEVIPPDLQKELDELRAAVKDSKEPQKEIDPALIKFQVQFGTLVKSFDEALGGITEIASEDNKKKYKTATHKLLDLMRGKLEEIQ